MSPSGRYVTLPRHILKLPEGGVHPIGPCFEGERAGTHICVPYRLNGAVEFLGLGFQVLDDVRQIAGVVVVRAQVGVFGG